MSIVLKLNKLYSVSVLLCLQFMLLDTVAPSCLFSYACAGIYILIKFFVHFSPKCPVWFLPSRMPSSLVPVRSHLSTDSPFSASCQCQSQHCFYPVQNYLLGGTLIRLSTSLLPLVVLLKSRAPHELQIPTSSLSWSPLPLHLFLLPGT